MTDIGIAHLTLLHLTPPELVSAAAGAGLDFVGIRLAPATSGEDVYPMRPGSPMLAETVHRIADTGVRVGDIEVFRLFGRPNLPDWSPILEAGATLGASYVNVLADGGDPRRYGDEFNSLVENAKPYGLTPVLEPMAYRQIRDLPQAIDIAARSKGGAVLVDALHLQRSGGHPADVGGASPTLFPYAQMCDGPIAAPTKMPYALRAARSQAVGGPLQAEARAGRLMPGDGVFPLVDLIHALPQGIPLSVEAPAVGVTDTLDAIAVAARARAAMLAVLTAANCSG